MDGETRLVGPLRAAPEEFHSVCSASQSARPRRSLDNQGHVYVGQVYHVPVELLLECQSVRWLLELGYGFPLLGEHLQALDGPHRRQQALQLGVGGGRGEALHRHDAGLRLALHHPQVLFVGHQAAPAHGSHQAPASAMHEHLLGRVDPLDALDAWRAGHMHVGPRRRVLRLLERPLGQRHLAGGLLPRLWGLREPLRLALRVKKAVALSSPA